MQPDFHAQSHHFVDIVPNNILSKGRTDLKSAWQWNAVIFYYFGTGPFYFGAFGDVSYQTILWEYMVLVRSQKHKNVVI